MRETLKTIALIMVCVMCATMTLLMMLMITKAEYVTSDNGLRVRKEPSTEAEILEVLPFGAEVSGEIEAGWMRLEGRDGYVKADYVSADDPHEGMTYMGEWRITAYAYTGSPCANGNFPQTGYTVACNSLPFGTKVYIDGVGVRTVEDTDGGRMGNEWLDLYLGTVSECIQWGDQTRKVWVVK